MDEAMDEEIYVTVVLDTSQDQFGDWKQLHIVNVLYRVGICFSQPNIV
jgi:hypothetical protein